MKRIITLIGIVILLLVSGGERVKATELCEGVVIATPRWAGLELALDPSIRAEPTGRFYTVGAHVTVIARHFNIRSGGMWFLIEGGYLQAYSGYRTDTIYMILVDQQCANALPLFFSDWYGQ